MIGFLKITSIRQGIIAISTFTSVIVLLIAATTIMLSDFFKERSAIVQSTAMLSNLVEINAGAMENAIALVEEGVACPLLTPTE